MGTSERLFRAATLRMSKRSPSSNEIIRLLRGVSPRLPHTTPGTDSSKDYSFRLDTQRKISTKYMKYGMGARTSSSSPRPVQMSSRLRPIQLRSLSLRLVKMSSRLKPVRNKHTKAATRSNELIEAAIRSVKLSEQPDLISFVRNVQ